MFVAIENFAFEIGGRATLYFIKGNIYKIEKKTLGFSICQLNMLMEINIISLEKCIVRLYNQSWLITMLPSLIARRWVGRQTL